MPIAALGAYMERLPARIAEYKLATAEAAMLPSLKDAARRSALRSWEREARRFSGGTARVAPTAVLKALGIGVRFVQ